VHRLTTS